LYKVDNHSQNARFLSHRIYFAKCQFLRGKLILKVLPLSLPLNIVQACNKSGNGSLPENNIATTLMFDGSSASKRRIYADTNYYNSQKNEKHPLHNFDLRDY
jgi:hypothetical protein